GGVAWITGRRPRWNKVGSSSRSSVLTREPPHRESSRLTITAFCSLILEANSARTPVGMPRSMPMSIMCLTRTPPPLTTSILCCFESPPQERQDHIATVIDDPVPTNLDYIQVGNQPQRNYSVVLSHEPLADHGLTFQPRFQFVPLRH